jgi:Carboxypeptidase regulatory-like domain
LTQGEKRYVLCRTMLDKKLAILIIIFVVTYLCPAVFSQSDNAQITGYVKDSSGGVIPDVLITTINADTGFKRSAFSNNVGYYAISQVPPGLYTITAEREGFRRFQEIGKKVNANLITSVNVVLELGPLSETLTVESRLSSVRSETATVGKLIDGQQIQSIQLNGRNPLFLALFVPGVVTQNPYGSSQSFSLSAGPLYIDGSRFEENLITYDGAVGVRTRSNGNSITVAHLEAVQEIQVLAVNYSAEYGRASGGQVRMITRSGTRDLHGSAFEFLRNSALDANGFERNRLNPAGDRPCSRFPNDPQCTPQPFRYNQFGYTLSGPVLLPSVSFNRERNKMFFLWGQEWVRRRRTATTTITVPSMAMRHGDFSELLNPANRFYGRVRVINDPMTGQPFSNNIIPSEKFSPNGLALLRAYPEPTPQFTLPGSANFYQERPEKTDQRKDTLSLDYYPRQNHQIRWRTQLFHYIDVAGFRNGTDRAPTVAERPNQLTSINWVWTLSPTLINEALVSGSRDQVYTKVDPQGGAYKRSAYGIDYPYVFPDRKDIVDKIPNVSFGSTIPELDGGPDPTTSTGPIYVVSDTVTKLWRNHTVKIGGLFERSGENDFAQINSAGVPGGTNNQNGRFEFRDTRPGAPSSGLDIANAALGLFSSYSEIGGRSYTPYRSHMFEWFVHDSWKLNPKLRFDFGLRYSLIQPHYSLWRNMALFDPRFYDPSIAVIQDPSNGYITRGDLASRYNGVVIPGSGWPESAHGRIPIADSGEFNFLFRGTPKEYSNLQKSDFQPRGGLAYAFNDRTVVRGGGGRYITRLGVSDSVFLGGNAPLQPMVSIANGSVDNPAGGTNNDFPLNITTRDRDLKNPEAWAWNLNFERDLGFDTIVEIAYVGRRGLHLQRERNINQLTPGTLQANPGVNENVLRPYKGFGPIRISSDEGKSQYHGLQLSGIRRFSNGFSFISTYTYSKLKDDGSDLRFLVPNTFDANNLWGPSGLDRTHAFIMNVVYDLPFLRSSAVWIRSAFGGWTISAITQFQSGTPVSVVTPDDFAGVGQGSGTQFWVVNGNPTLPRADRHFSNGVLDSNYWFAIRNPDGMPIFTPPASGTFNQQSVRNLIYGPGFQAHNAAISKNFRVNEKQQIQFRGEAFNWPNHPNWSAPDSNPKGSTFGKVTRKQNERQIQLSLRYTF